MIKCADMLDRGDGLDVDKNEAIEYYKMAVDEGDENGKISFERLIGEGVTSPK